MFHYLLIAKFKRFATLFIVLCCFAHSAYAACVDNVVLVHGNAGKPENWDNTYTALLDAGYSAAQIFRPNWGSKTCAACNDHKGSEEQPVREALMTALDQSCTGQIDVIAHSMGVTLAGQQIRILGINQQVETFVGIAGALKGLNSCGVYPFNIPTTTCASWGLSVSSPFLDDLYGKNFGNYVFSIKSYIDQIVCATGFCTVGGIHTSRIWDEDATYTFTLGHFGLQSDTATLQLQLIQ